MKSWNLLLVCLLLCAGCAGQATDKRAKARDFLQRHDTAVELVVRATAGRALTQRPGLVEPVYQITETAIKAIEGDSLVSLKGLGPFIVSRIAWSVLTPEETDILLPLVNSVREEIQNYLLERGVAEPKESLVYVAEVLKWINQTAEIRRVQK